MFKLVVGILKGAVIGGALGYGAFALKEATGFGNPWLTYGLVGALVGLITGRPIWTLLRDKNATAWESILRALFGFGLGCGLYALLAKVANPSPLIVQGFDIFTWQASVGAAIGVVGSLVFEVDAIGDDKKPGGDSSRPGTAPGAKAAPKAKGTPGR